MLVLMCLLALSGCAQSQTAQPEVPSPVDGTIAIRGVHIEQGSISFTGETTLPDGACIQTQLQADNDEVTWWPSDACVNVHSGTWEIRVQLGVDGAPDEMNSSAQYIMRAWSRDTPSILATFNFDLTGPPVPGS
jgi:hypothetical protein